MFLKIIKYIFVFQSEIFRSRISPSSESSDTEVGATGRARVADEFKVEAKRRMQEEVKKLESQIEAEFKSLLFYFTNTLLRVMNSVSYCVHWPLFRS